MPLAPLTLVELAGGPLVLARAVDFALLVGADVGVSRAEPLEALAVALVVDPFALVDSRVGVGDDALAVPLALLNLPDVDTVLVRLYSKVALLFDPSEVDHVRHYRLVAQVLLLLSFTEVLLGHPLLHSLTVRVDPRASVGLLPV